MDERFAKPFDLLLGRKTYDIFAAYWPYADAEDPIGTAFNRAAKHVATRNPDLPLTWQNSHRLGPDAVAAVRALKAGDGPDLLTQGSADFLQTLFAHDLVDELWISVFPVVLGEGKRLFGAGTTPAALKLVASRVSGTGVVTATYVRDGEVRTGSFAAPEPSEAELERRRNLS
jgi:dihydrofolate reductase